MTKLHFKAGNRRNNALSRQGFCVSIFSIHILSLTACKSPATILSYLDTSPLVHHASNLPNHKTSPISSAQSNILNDATNASFCARISHAHTMLLYQLYVHSAASAQPASANRTLIAATLCAKAQRKVVRRSQVGYRSRRRGRGRGDSGRGAQGGS